MLIVIAAALTHVVLREKVLISTKIESLRIHARIYTRLRTDGFLYCFIGCAPSPNCQAVSTQVME